MNKKKNISMALIVAAAYLAIYLIGRVIWCDLSDSNFIGWLVSVRPNGEHSYLYGWLLSSKLFWIALVISTLPAIWGKFKFSFTTLAGFIVGLLAGMIFGSYPEGAAIGQTHFGWAIWGVIYLLSIIAGILVERFVKKGRTMT